MVKQAEQQKGSLVGVFGCALVALLLVAGPVRADTISLTGTVRDFSAAHVDFESFLCGGVTGLVETTLGPDKNPDLSATGTSCITSPDSFDQWYAAVPGVNAAIALDLIFDNTVTADPAVFTFSDTSFFPIDGLLFGNEGNAHNYHFTSNCTLSSPTPVARCSLSPVMMTSGCSSTACWPWISVACTDR